MLHSPWTDPRHNVGRFGGFAESYHYLN
jgi:hypothetical protein